MAWRPGDIPWLSAPLGSHCPELYHSITHPHPAMVPGLLPALQLPSGCTLLCTTTRIRSKFIEELVYWSLGVSIAFHSEMMVTKASLVELSPVKFLPDIGGLLGLWLGWGAPAVGGDRQGSSEGQLVNTTYQLARLYLPS